jgi:hypothetical protein
VKRIDYWKAKLPAARAEMRRLKRQYSQTTLALLRAVTRVNAIEKRIEDEKAKLARLK